MNRGRKFIITYIATSGLFELPFGSPTYVVLPGPPILGANSSRVWSVGLHRGNPNGMSSGTVSEDGGRSAEDWENIPSILQDLNWQ